MVLQQMFVKGDISFCVQILLSKLRLILRRGRFERITLNVYTF